MYKLRYMTVGGFRNLNDLNLETDPITILVGRTGAGKTNVLHALRLLRNLVATDLSEPLNRNDWRNGRPGNGEMHWQVGFEYSGRIYTYEIATALLTKRVVDRREPAERYTCSFERLAIDSEDLFVRGAGILEGTLIDHLPKKFPEELLIRALAHIPTVRHAFIFLAYGIGFYDFPSDVLTTPSELSTARHLADDGKNSFEIMQRLFLDLDRPDEWAEFERVLCTANANARSIKISPESGDILQLESDGQSRPITRESEGFRRLAAMVLALHQVPTPPQLVFEEPERGLHPGAIALLVDEFKAFVKSCRGQILFTTHSPELLSSFDATQLRVVDIRSEGTTVGHVSRGQIDSVKKHLLTTGELLTVDPARIDDEQGSAT